MSPYRGYWRELLESMLLVAAGGCAGARMAGASVWVGLVMLPLLVAWLVAKASHPGPDDPPRERVR